MYRHFRVKKLIESGIRSCRRNLNPAVLAPYRVAICIGYRTGGPIGPIATQHVYITWIRSCAYHPPPVCLINIMLRD